MAIADVLLRERRSPTYVRTFRDLKVYQAAFRNANRIFDISATFPEVEKWRLIDQILRSSSAVGALIAEAWRRRRYEKSFINKLNEAEAEAAETQHWLAMAHYREYLSNEEWKALDDEYEHILSQLVILIDQADRWVLRKP